MKKMSKEAKYYIYMLLAEVICAIAFLGLLFGEVMIGDWLIHTSLWLVIGHVTLTGFVGYLALCFGMASAEYESQKEDR